MKAYLDMIDFIMKTGVDRDDRTGVGTRSIFGYQLRFDLQKGFPILTTKKIPFKSVVSELLWMIEGSTDERRLSEILHGTRDPSKTTIWSANAQASYWVPNAKFEGDLGRVYGAQWRDWTILDSNFVDQLSNVIENIMKNPNDRRHIVSSWNPGELDKMALPPCHMFFQFYVVNGTLNLLMYQRSADVFLGVPFNIASYSLLLHMVAQCTNLKPHEFIHVLGDTHIYLNHLDAVDEQLNRDPYHLPTLQLNPNVKNIFDFTMDDISLIDYKSHPIIKAPMAV